MERQHLSKSLAFAVGMSLMSLKAYWKATITLQTQHPITSIIITSPHLPMVVLTQNRHNMGFCTSREELTVSRALSKSREMSIFSHIYCPSKCPERSELSE